MLKKIVIIILVLLYSSLTAAGFKKYAGEFLAAGVGSRALSMGGAFVAVANDVTAGYWNPAGLLESKGLQIQFMHARQFMSSIQYDYLGFSKAMHEDAAFGLSLIRWGVNDIKDSRNALAGDQISEGIDYSKITSFNIADYVLFVSYGLRYNEDISIGANVKIIYRDFYAENAMGLGFDAGLKYRLFQDFYFGLLLRDVTTTMMAWSTDEKEFITPSLRPGISYKLNFESIDLYVQPAVDMAILLESRKSASQLGFGIISFDTFWGLEAGFKDICFLRLGYDDLSRFNAGIGLSINKFAVDYSYTNFDDVLGNVHRISFHLKLPGY